MKLAVAFAAFCALMPGMSNQDPAPPAPTQPTITISPIPPQQGQTMVVTYTGGTLPVTLEIDWDPSGTPTSVTIPKSGSARVTVPTNATSVIVTDPVGGAPANGSVIAP